MDEFLAGLSDELITVGIGAAILGAAWVVCTLSKLALVFSSFTDENFSWKELGKGFFKASIWAVSLLGFVTVLELLTVFAQKVDLDITGLIQDASTLGIIGVVLTATGTYIAGAYRNLKQFLLGDGESKVDTTDAQPDYHTIATKVYNLFKVPEGLAKAQEDFEKKIEEEIQDGVVDSGVGTYYSVPYGSYDEFKNAVLGKGFDVDGVYDFQCWDGACLLWMQIGRWLSTGGTGAARGCWTNAKEENAGSDFELIYDKSQIRRGDVVVFGMGTFGHIGFADQDYQNTAYITLLGQNQGGTPKGTYGAGFNVVNVSLNSFLGAFRFKNWQSSPEPTPTPTPSGIKEGDTVWAWGRGTATSYGTGAVTKDYPRQKMKVILINNNHYALNQYNQGAVGNAGAVTGWWASDQVEKA